MKPNNIVADLFPMFDSRKSFYGKAKVFIFHETGHVCLDSYNTRVAVVHRGKVTLKPAWDQTQTTLRHVKEFLKQQGFTAETKSQIQRDYVTQPTTS